MPTIRRPPPVVRSRRCRRQTGRDLERRQASKLAYYERNKYALRLKARDRMSRQRALQDVVAQMRRRASARSYRFARRELLNTKRLNIYRKHQISALGDGVQFNKFDDADAVIAAFEDICKMEHGGHPSPPLEPAVVFNEDTLTEYLKHVGLNGVYQKQRAARLTAAAPPTPPASPPPVIAPPPVVAPRRPMQGPLSPPVRPRANGSRALSTPSAHSCSAPAMGARPTRSIAGSIQQYLPDDRAAAVAGWVDATTDAMAHMLLDPDGVAQLPVEGATSMQVVSPASRSTALGDAQSASSVDDESSASYIVVASGAPTTIFASWRNAQRERKALALQGYKDARIRIAKNGAERDRIISEL
ncbi:hypothetical protein BD626DRAFT_575817 [Schizophyllum amplum]|uniref:Uncharacterized protein n=1 Tax=Schizophyllum amplum TaxID=97359 RepID=A0A550BUX2_9AGAR|nr:hypothetical protein BD626DRAFT_575817 [Auriculariopsis ampla]